MFYLFTCFLTCSSVESLAEESVKVDRRTGTGSTGFWTTVADTPSGLKEIFLGTASEPASHSSAVTTGSHVMRASGKSSLWKTSF